MSCCRLLSYDCPVYSHEPDDYQCPICDIACGADNPDGWTTQAEVLIRNESVVPWINAQWWPKNHGAVLISPVRHFENIYYLPPELAVGIQTAARFVSLAMKQCYGCDGVSTRQHNEPAGNQEVWHYHLHVFPRYVGDRLYERQKEKERFPISERVAYAQRLRPVIERISQEESL